MASSSKSKTKKSTTAQPTSAAAWKGKRATGNIPLELPSGNVCLVRTLGISELISEGLLADSLMPIVQEQIDRGTGRPPTGDHKKKSKKKDGDPGVGAEIMRDPHRMAEMFDGIDKALPKIVAEPTLLYHRHEVEEGGLKTWETIPAEERDEDALYTDVVDFEDKLFIFNFAVGGTADLETFRQESGEPLASL